MQDFSRTQTDFSRTLKFTFFLTLSIKRSHCLPYISFFFTTVYQIFRTFRDLTVACIFTIRMYFHNKIPILSRFSTTPTNPGLRGRVPTDYQNLSFLIFMLYCQMLPNIQMNWLQIYNRANNNKYLKVKKYKSTMIEEPW